MDTTLFNAVNCGVCWLLVGLSMMGYFVTLKRTHNKWPLWLILTPGWGLLAVAHTLLAAGVLVDTRQLAVLWLSSYVLVTASLLLLFLKLVSLIRNRNHQGETKAD